MDKKKSLTYLNPKLALEWHPVKNDGLTPDDVTPESHICVWWKCSNNHEWLAQIYSRNKGLNCPYCKNRKLLKGYNDLATVNPVLAKEWNYERNEQLTPSDLIYSSGKKVWWICNKGHEWESTPYSRNKGGGCPYCSNKRVLVGFNDLATTDPGLASEWNYEKNGDLLPTDITRGAGKKVWWKCTLGHEWCTTPNKRTTDNNACPYCSNHKVLSGFNDIATTYPRLAAEWHPTKNANLTARDITAGSSKKIWWLCSKGHEWIAAPCNRIKNRNCPICSKQLKTSFPEQATLYYLKRYFNEVNNNITDIIGMEFDIYIPDIKTAIEYDGFKYHNSSCAIAREKRKNKLCFDKGIRLIRMRENGLDFYGDCECIAVDNPSDYKTLDMAISKVLNLLGIKKCVINVISDMSDILNSYLISESKNSLNKINPELAKEWHPTKNGNLKPEHLAAHSSRFVWWKCEMGHEWKASVHNRSKGKGCPYCSGRTAVTGENDLATMFPDIAKEWNYSKNRNTLPCEVKPGSSRRFWWKCKNCGYEWNTTVHNRTSGSKCPNCWKAENGLSKRKSPEKFEKELNAINKNIQLLNRYVVSTQKVKCHCKVCGNEWEALPGNLLKGKGCPVCARQRLKYNKST